MLKAIDTYYNGCWHRSRNEAKWAVVLVELGLTYRYEPQGWDLGAQGYYLPDFEVTKQPMARVNGQPDEVWIEIKAGTPTTREEQRQGTRRAVGTDRRYLSLSAASVRGVGAHDAGVPCYPSEQGTVYTSWIPLYESLLLLTCCRPGTLPAYHYRQYMPFAGRLVHAFDKAIHERFE
jgi:hypothetical protein